MTAVAGKKVLFVGESTTAIDNLHDMLTTMNVKASKVTCLDALQNLSTFNGKDLVVLNNTSDPNQCLRLLKTLQDTPATKALPVLSLTEGTEVGIQTVLMSGAADYFTAEEDLASVLQKVKSNFGVPDNFSGSTAVDISEKKEVSNMSSVRVYVVEDDPLLQSLLATKFEMSGINFDFSTDGVDVITKIQEFKPTVIVFDIMIGAVNGLDLLESVKSDSKLKSIPAIVFSNQDSFEERERASKQGAAAYLVKATTDLSDLMKMLGNLSKG